MIFANGFKRSGLDGVLVHKDYENLEVYYYVVHFEWDDWIVKEWGVPGISGIEYVREFQQYLRLCGFKELADDFKVI